VFQRIEAALQLLADHEPLRLKRFRRDIRRILIKRAGYAPAYYLHALRVCVLDREFVTADGTTASWIAVALVHEATHARLEGRKITYVEELRPRIESVCDAQTVVFARRLPDGESLAQRIIETQPTSASHWSNDNLDRRLFEAGKADRLDAFHRFENSEAPEWLKRIVRRIGRSRAA
jgi:hypothetical protein